MPFVIHKTCIRERHKLKLDKIEYDPLLDRYIVNNNKDDYLHWSHIRLFSFILIHEDTLKPYTCEETLDYLASCKPYDKDIMDMF